MHVAWQTLNVSGEVAQHYGYLVQVRENSAATEYTVEERIAHNGFDGSYDIQGLRLNTEYVIEVTYCNIAR